MLPTADGIYMLLDYSEAVVTIEKEERERGRSTHDTCSLNMVNAGSNRIRVISQRVPRGGGASDVQVS